MPGQRIELVSVFFIASLFVWPLGAQEGDNEIPDRGTEEILSEIGATPNPESEFEALPFGQYIEEIVAENPPEEALVTLAKKAEEPVVEPVVESVVLVPEKAAVTEPRLRLSQGTYVVQGAMSLLYKLTGFSYTQHALHLQGKAGVGYFIKDYVAVGANIVSSLKFFPLRMGEIGISPFSTYYFAIGRTFYPYVGFEITPRYSLQERSILLSGGINAGLLLSLAEHVGLDFGLEPRLHFRLNNQQKWRFEVPVGFIGVKAFF